MTDGDLAVPVTREDHARGAAGARLTLVEYGDYQCPHCRRAYEVLKTVLAELDEDVRFVFRNFPRTDTYPDAAAAAEAAEAVAVRAGEASFWVMHAVLYENQDALETDDLLAYAEAAGADPALVAMDLASNAMAPRVHADVAGAITSGVDATPAFFLNGRRFDGPWMDAALFIARLRAAAREDALP